MRGRITDQDGGFTDYTTTITVNNVAPVDQRRSSASPTRSTRAARPRSPSRATDPAGANDPLSYEFDCDDNGTYEVGPQAGQQHDLHLRRRPGALRTIDVRVTDGDGGADTDSVSVDVTNVAPTITSLIRSPTAVVVGRSVTGASGQRSDPSNADTLAGIQLEVQGSEPGRGAVTDRRPRCTTVVIACGPLIVRAQARDKDSGEF